MRNSTESTGKRPKYFYWRIRRLATICLLLACLGSSCISTNENVKNTNPRTADAKKNTQLTANSKGRTTKSQSGTSYTTGENTYSGSEKTRSSSPSASMNFEAVLGDLSPEEKNVLAWLIGGVLGLAFIMLIIKGIISKRR